MIDSRRVVEALGRVRDPELDEPITDLRFVETLEVEGDTVRVRMRLPTYFCAPNFSYMMAADARAAIAAVPGVRRVELTLVDHFASDEINAGMASGSTFRETFPGQTEKELDDLRALFARKALLARQQRLCEALVQRGISVEEVAGMRLRDVPPCPELHHYLARRRELGLDVRPDAPLLVDGAGRRIPSQDVSEHLRLARTVRVSIEANAGLCRSLLATRYGIPDPEEATV